MGVCQNLENKIKIEIGRLIIPSFTLVKFIQRYNKVYLQNEGYVQHRCIIRAVVEKLSKLAVDITIHVLLLA